VSKKILLVDDSATSLLMHRQMVARNTKYMVLSAQDGEQALKLASTEKPDLILMDIMMPGMDGLEVCQRLRRQKDTSLVPIILLTFSTGSDSVQKGFESGCTAYLTKPVQETELVKTLQRYLGD
jgi:CheY-like chemotaxis protein